MDIQTAIIGVTGFGTTHFAQLVRLHREGRARLAAATVINPAEAAEACATLRELGAQVFDDYRAMLDALRGRLDLCCIPTGIAWHAPMTCDALDAGAHVFVEKPLAGSLEDVDRILAARDRAGRFVAVGFQDIYDPQHLNIKRRLLDGAVGAIHSVRVIGVWPRPHSYYRRNAWAGRLRDGRGAWVRDSPANNAMSHYLNLGLFFAGAALDRSLTVSAAEARLWRANAIESFDTITARLSTNEGVEVGVYMTHAALETREVEIRIQGEKGRLIWALAGKVCRLELADGRIEDFAVAVLRKGFRTVMFDALIRRLHNPAVWICLPEIARAHTQAIEHIHASGPILDAPAGRVRTQPFKQGDTITVIEGIAEELERGFESGRMLGD